MWWRSRPKAGVSVVLERETGKPVFPVEERAARSEVPGEQGTADAALCRDTEPYDRPGT